MDEKRKKPSAMSQVGNRVNAGLMDALVGGMCEEGDTPDYEIGMENNSNLEYAHVTNGSAAAPLSEEAGKGFDYRKYMRSIVDYMQGHGLKVKPFPKVILDTHPQDGLFIMTGHYEPGTKKVVLYTSDRHPKDILRSFAHEMVHHAQNLRGWNLSYTKDDNVFEDRSLEEIEAEAYLTGNLMFRKWTEEWRKSHTLNENRMGEFISPEDVDLDSFNIRPELNPKFWKDGHLDTRIRMKLFDISDDFIDFLDIPWAEPVDIIITGSLANYNWNEKYSDIDLHIIYDFSDVDENTDMVKKFFDAARKEWNNSHKGLTIYGFPVEIYVQDAKETHVSTGVYSLDKDKWLEEPERRKESSLRYDKEKVREKVSDYTRRIDNLEELLGDAGDGKYIPREVYEKAGELMDELKKIRKEGLDSDKGEFSEGNLIFKSLRRTGYIARLLSVKRSAYDNFHSLN